MVVKNIKEVISALIDDYSYEETIKFDESFDKTKIFDELSKKR